MQQSAQKPPLPLWLVILIIGTIVGVSMGRTQSMGLYLPQVTKALDIGREPFGLAMALAQLTLGLGAPFFGGLIDKFGAGRIVIMCVLAAIAGIYFMYSATSANDLLLSVANKALTTRRQVFVAELVRSELAPARQPMARRKLCPRPRASAAASTSRRAKIAIVWPSRLACGCGSKCWPRGSARPWMAC